MSYWDGNMENNDLICNDFLEANYCGMTQMCNTNDSMITSIDIVHRNT